MSNTLISLLKEVKSRLSEISELKAEIAGKESDMRKQYQKHYKETANSERSPNVGSNYTT